MTQRIRITGYQMPVTDNLQHNKGLILDAIKNTPNDCDWFVTPEGSLSGYMLDPGTYAGDRRTPQDLINSCTEIEEAAKKKNIGLALGTCWIEKDNLPYNQLRFYNADIQNGWRLLHVHNKIALTKGWVGSGEEIAYTKGNQLGVVDYKNIKIGGLVCNDMWLLPECSPNNEPYLAGVLANNFGMQVCFVSANCNTTTHDPLAQEWHDLNLRIQAKTFNIWIVVVNSSLDMLGNPLQGELNCKSGVIGPDGEWKVVQKDPNGIFHYTINF